MTIQCHFSCGASDCKKHVHVTIICHDDQEYDHDKLGEAIGFYEKPQGSLIEVNKWRCEEHASWRTT